KLDLVTADYGANVTSVFLGNGDGSFAGRISYATGTGPIPVTTADFNGDGKLDVVTADYGAGGNSISVFFGTGDGPFACTTSSATSTCPTPATPSPYTTHFRSKLVLVTADYGANVTSVFLGNGDGSFAGRTSYATGTGPYSVTTADFNGDGKLD